LRFEEDTQGSQKLLEDINKALVERRMKRPAMWSIQAGLNYFVLHQHAKSLRCFSEAESASPDDFELLLCKLNKLLIQEYEGQISKERLTDVERLILESQDPLVSSGQLRELVLSLRARILYRQGNISALSDMMKELPHQDQLTYFLAWVASHPLIDVPHRDQYLESALEFLLDRYTKGYLLSYNRMTILGQVESDKQPQAKLSDMVERLYLWTWKWLVSGHQHYLAAILDILDIIKSLGNVSCSYEDYLLLRCSVKWLTLFADDVSEPLRDTLSKLSPGKISRLPLLEFEEAVVDQLTASKSRGLDDFTKKLKFQGFDARLARSILNVMHPDQSEYPLFFRSLNQLLMDRTMDNGTVVSQGESSVAIYRKRKRIVESYEPLNKAALFATKFDEADINTFYYECFGFRRLDNSLNDSKIAKLLVRANKTFNPDIYFSKRGEKIFFEIDDDRVLRLEKNILQDQLKEALAFRSSVTEDVISSDQQLLQMTRLQIEQTLGKSKTSTSRLISKWVAEGSARKLSAGSKTFYEIEPHLFVKIKNGEVVH
jgi:hypothetical protein